MKSTHWTLSPSDLPIPHPLVQEPSMAVSYVVGFFILPRPDPASSPVTSLHMNFPKNKPMRSASGAPGVPSCWSVQILPIFQDPTQLLHAASLIPVADGDLARLRTFGTLYHYPLITPASIFCPGLQLLKTVLIFS